MNQVNATQTMPDNPAPTKPRFVAKYSWWKSRDGKRQFAVVEKVTVGLGVDFKTIGIRLLEVGDSNTFYHELDEFWKLVDRGSLTEMIPE